jgi:hypothetical protein
MRKVWVVLSVLMLAACTSDPAPAAVSTPSPSGAPTVTPTAGPTIDGGCASSPASVAAPPDWTASAKVSRGPFVLSHEANLVGYLFVTPLRAGQPTNPANKILWVVKTPRNGQPLKLELRRMDGTGEPVSQIELADSGPGEIYPSIVDVPSAGCWQVQAGWNGHLATLELLYQ